MDIINLVLFFNWAGFVFLKDFDRDFGPSVVAIDPIQK